VAARARGPSESAEGRRRAVVAAAAAATLTLIRRIGLGGPNLKLRVQLEVCAGTYRNLEAAGAVTQAASVTPWLVP
jgi:hypothetical protein